MPKEVKRVAVVGAGLGGLAAAIALRQQGFEVRVYEQSPELGAFGAGINISPNAVRIFTALGLHEALHAVSFEPKGLIWRDAVDCKRQNLVRLDDAKQRYGTNYYAMHRGDLYRVLKSAVPDDMIERGKRCVSVEDRDDCVAMTFADGSTDDADIVVGCDGIRSAVRKSIFGGQGPRYAGHMCWRTLIPVESLPPKHHDNFVTNWTGVDGFILTYYVRQGKFINVVAVRRQADWDSESWSEPSTKSEMLAGFSHAGSQVQTILENAGDVFKWGQFTGEPADVWTKGRVALLGDSAHAMLATFGQGAAMSFEDAYVFARWLAVNRDDHASALAGYEAVRKPRASHIQQLSRTEVEFKRLRTPMQKLRREWTYLKRFRTTTPAVYRWIFGFDPVTNWR